MSQIKTLKSMRAPALLATLALTVACTTGSSGGANNPLNTPTQVADKAMNNEGVVMALPSSGGFYGSLYIQPRDLMTAPDTQTVGCDQRGLGALGIQAFLSQPTWVTQQVLFQSLNIPAQNFLQGFPMGSNSGLISVDSYFAIDVTGVFHLAAGEPEGDYQFAAISDDGAQVFINSGDGLPQLLVDDEKPASWNNGTCLSQTQPAHMSCTSIWGTQTAPNVQTVHLAPGDEIPLEVTYWQGPGQGLALIVLYRQVPSDSSQLVDADCGQQLPFSAGDASTNDLMTRWQVISYNNLSL